MKVIELPKKPETASEPTTRFGKTLKKKIEKRHAETPRSKKIFTKTKALHLSRWEKIKLKAKAQTRHFINIPKYRYVSILLLVTITASSVLFYNSRTAQGATYTFTQTDWTQQSANVGAHPGDQDDWEKFSAKDSSIDLANAGSEVTLSPDIVSATDDGSLTTTGGATGGGFGNGSHSGTTNSGSGSAGEVTISGSAKSAIWARMADFGVSTSSQTSLVAASSDEIFANEGTGNNFHRYTASTDSWQSRASAPGGGFGLGNSMVYVSTGDYIYATQGSGTGFYRYSVSGNTWSTMTSVTASVGAGSKLVYPGSGNFLYLTRGGSTTDFYRYSISGNSWSAMTSTTAAVIASSTATATATEVFFLRGATSPNFYRYSIGGNSWSTSTALPVTPGTGSGISYPGSGTFIYANAGSSTSTYRFNTSGATWTRVTSSPTSIASSIGTPNGGSYMYAFTGTNTNFYRYNYSGDDQFSGSWTTLTPNGTNFGVGNSSAYTPSEDHVYSAVGGGTVFRRYSISGDSWSTMTALPISAIAGASLVKISGDIYYATSNAFYKYSVSGNSWTAMTSVPGAVGAGSNLSYPASGDYIYLTRGGTTTDFYRYSISGDSWTSMTSAPGNIAGGGDLTYPGSGNYLYSSAGGASAVFYRYSISGNSWATMTSSPVNVNTGGAMEYPGSGNFLYQTAGNAGSEFMRYSILTDTWVQLTGFPVTIPASQNTTITSIGSGLMILNLQGTSTSYRFSLGSTSGIFTSAIIDLSATSELTTLDFNTTLPTGSSITIDIRSGPTASPDGSWSAWLTDVSDGGSIASLPDSRYVQYRANLSLSLDSGPALNDITINYTAFPASQTLTSSIYNTGDATNIIGTVSWTEDTSLPAGTTVTYSLRTASSEGGITAAAWTDFTNATSGCSKSLGVVTCSSSAIPAGMKDGSGDQYWQYKLTLGSTGENKPTVTTVVIQYIVNAPPTFDATFGTNGINVEQISNSADPDWGMVSISYRVRDTDTDTGSSTPGFITPSFEYNIGGGWVNIAAPNLEATDLNNKAVDDVSYTTYTALWDAKTQIPDSYDSAARIRVTANDNEQAQNTGTATSGNFELDTTAPTATLKIDSSTDKFSLVASDDSDISYLTSNDVDLSADGTNAQSGVWQNSGTGSVNVNPSWNFTGSPAVETLYASVRDQYGNSLDLNAVAPATLTNFDLHDTSNSAALNFRMFLSWGVYTNAAGVTFDSYEIYRSTDNSTFTKIQTITDRTTNFYLDTSVDNLNTYYYKVVIVDSDDDTSNFTAVMSDLPDGEAAGDSTPPEITEPTAEAIQSTSATITWVTDEISNSEVEYALPSDTPVWESVTSESYVTEHSVTLEDLDKSTEYLFRVTSTDILSNSITDDDGGANYSFTTSDGPTITDVSEDDISNSTATVSWNTDIASDSYVIYSTSTTNLDDDVNINTAGSNALVTQQGLVYPHTVNLSALLEDTEYFYYIKSTDADGNIARETNNGNYYSFTTIIDNVAPVISDITVPVITSNSAAILWTTDEPADGIINYGTTSGNLTEDSGLNATLTVNHAASLSALTPETTYFYTITSKDAQDNETVSSEQQFTTTAEGETVTIVVGGGGGGSNADKTAPKISNVQVTNIKAFEATVSFSTSEDTAGFVEYGENVALDRSAGSSSYKNTHSFTLKGLKPGTSYDYLVSSIDKGGNAAKSDAAKFTTKFVAEDLEDLVDLNNAESLQQDLENLLEQTTPSLIPPFIADVTVKDINENSATVTWNTNIPAYSVIYYSSSRDRVENSSLPYAYQVAQVDVKSTSHEFKLTGLNNNTKYLFQAQSFVLPKVVRKSKEFSFTTQSVKISPEITRTGNTDLEVRWFTETNSNSYIEIKNVKTGKITQVSSSEYVKNHLLTLDKLDPNTEYELRAISYDENNVRLESDSQIVKTKSDNDVAKISNEKIINSLFPGKKDILQTVVTWKTDEPSNSILYYEEGVGSANAPLANKASKEDEYTTEHVIILSTLKPGTVYRFKIASADESKNVAETKIRTILTPNQTESILDIIIKNFESSFGFFKNINK